MFIVFNDLVKFGKLSFLVFSKFFHDEGLCVNCIAHLLLEFLDRGLHPMSVIKSWLNVFLFQLKFDLGPYLANLKMRVHLDDFHLLLFMSVQIVFVKADAVQNAKNNEPNIIFLDLLFDSVNQICLHTCFSQVLKIGLFLL